MGAKYKGLDILGLKFTRLLVVKHIPEKSHHQADYWECRCDCGNVMVLLTRQLIKGNVKSCGCLLADFAKSLGENNKQHGMRNTRQYQIWRGIKARCCNSKNPNWEHYGGRGISYDPRRLLKDFGKI